MHKFPDFAQGLVPTADAYFLVETQDGETLHALITGSKIGSRLARDPHNDNPDPVDDIGHHFRFKCSGDSRAGGYFFARSVLRDDGTSPECEWILESSVKDRNPKQYKFVGALYDYRELPLSNSESEFFGTIKIPF